jgi:hypothetical protein
VGSNSTTKQHRYYEVVEGCVMFTHTKASRALAALSDPLARNLFSCDADGKGQTPQHWVALRS